MGENEKIDERTYKFARRIVKLYDYLKEQRKSYGLGDQIFRSGTSIGANVAEAKYAQSNLDFISKYSIALKEANETMYWLRLLRDSQYIGEPEAKSMIDDCDTIVRILITIIKRLKEAQQSDKEA